MKRKFFYKKWGILCLMSLFCSFYALAETSDKKKADKGNSASVEAKAQASQSDSTVKAKTQGSQPDSTVEAKVQGLQPDSTVEASYSDYFVYLGTSFLRRRDMEKAVFFGKTFTFGIGRKDWNYQELRINLRAIKKNNRSEIIHAELLPRLFYSFPVMGLTSYTGLGLGIGFSPFKRPEKTVSVNAQLFTGVKAITVYRRLGCFVEMNLTYLTLPFFNKEFGSFFNEQNEFFDALLNAGVIYNF